MASNGTHAASTIRSQLARLAEIVALSSKLAAEREEIVAWFEAREAPGASAPPAPPAKMSSSEPSSRGMHPGSFSSRIVAFLEKEPGRIFSIGEIHAAIGEGKKKRALRTGLYDLMKRKKIRRVEEGLYQALQKGAPTP